MQKYGIYSIIKNGRVKKRNKKGECIFIFIKKFKYYTKETSKIFSIILLGFIIIIAILSIKYKPTYIVSVSGEKLGYVEDKAKFEETINKQIIQYKGENVENVSLNTEPSYELKLVDRVEETNEEEIIIALQKDTTITYKYYEIALGEDKKTYVDTQEEADSVVNQIKEEHEDAELNFEINEIITENLDGVTTEEVEIAKASLEPEAEKIIEEESAPQINGIKLAVTPISGTITSRYGVSSRIRSGAHTGLDIATSSGTPIKAVATGTVTAASYSGAYGNLVKISHGDGVETWYGHCSKLYVSAGQKVNAGDVIAAVGSTGNSTGPHLHLEIRINGNTVNPQKYLYN